MMGFGFSGYLLPWNELAFFATKVGTGIAGAAACRRLPAAVPARR
jgi:quinol-cytochrome oxidoreductase complex cytochrome b subunit